MGRCPGTIDYSKTADVCKDGADIELYNRVDRKMTYTHKVDGRELTADTVQEERGWAFQNFVIFVEDI